MSLMGNVCVIQGLIVDDLAFLLAEFVVLSSDKWRKSCGFVCFSEIALQQVSMFFRSDLKWEVLEPLRDMGEVHREQLPHVSEMLIMVANICSMQARRIT